MGKRSRLTGCAMAFFPLLGTPLATPLVSASYLSASQVTLLGSSQKDRGDGERGSPKMAAKFLNPMPCYEAVPVHCALNV